MSKLQRVDELASPPIVGRYYLVPCVRESGGSWWPVRGPLHDDAEIIGVHQKHWHYDVRFIHRKALPYVCGDEAERAARKYVSILSVDHVDSAIEYQKLRCFRVDVDFPESIRLVTGGRSENPFARPLEDKFERIKLKCLTCPHRGFS